MTTTHKYATPNTIETVLSTELDSLANSGGTATSAAIDNSAGLYKFADFETLTKQSLTAGDCHILFFRESVDGTNYEDGDTSMHGAQLIASIRVFVNNSAYERHIFRGIVLPPTKFKVIFQNWSSSGLAATGNTVKMIRYNEADA